METLESKISLAALLRIYRKEKGIIQTELAERVGMAPSYITHIEIGRKRNISFEYIDKIADILKLRHRRREIFYQCAGYTQEGLKIVPSNKRKKYPYLFDILTSKPRDISIEDYAEAMSDVIKLIRDNIPGSKEAKRKKFLKILASLSLFAQREK